MKSRRNDIQLSPHFNLREFENVDGWVMVHPSVIESLEAVRERLQVYHTGRECAIVITGSTRTKARNIELARVQGWQGDGGTVSRDSKHLEQYGGIAVDLKAYICGTRQLVPQRTLGDVCRLYFDYVKADYADGHVHADNRTKGK